MWTDLRLAIRGIARAPFSALSAVVTLGVGIGVTLVVLGTLDGFFWRPLPYPGVERLVGVVRAHPPFWRHKPQTDVATAELVRQRVPALEDVALAREQGVRVLTSGGQLSRMATWTTPNAFRMLGVPPLLGRIPDRELGDDGAAELAVSEPFWLQYLGGRADVLGSTLVVDGRPATIVGVMPRGFRFHFNSDLWLALDSDALLHTPDAVLLTMGRLREGATIEQARREAAALEPHLPVHRPYEATARLFILDEIITRNALPLPLARLIIGVALLVLVVGCANVANLLLVRTLTRRSEIAIRAALGGGPAALMRPALFNGALIAILGGGLGFALATWGNLAIAGALGEALPEWVLFRVDGRFAAAAALAIVSVLLATVMPALHISRRTDVMALISSSGHTPPPALSRVSHIALAVQVTIMCGVTTAAVQVYGTYREMAGLNPGFPADELLAVELATSDPTLEFDNAAWASTLESIANRLEGAPGVAGVTHLWGVDRTTGRAAFASVGGQSAPDAEGESSGIRMSDTLFTDTAPQERVSFRIAGPTKARAVGPTFFDVTGIRLRDGRRFTTSDRREGESVVILSQTLAAALWRDESAVGRRLRLGPEGPWVTVVGVAADQQVVRASSWEGTIVGPEYTVYFPQAQAEAFSPRLLVRHRAGSGGGSGPLDLVPLVEQAVAESGVGLSMERVRLHAEDFEVIAREGRVLATILGGCALVIVGLGAIGLFAVLAFYATTRLPELAIRSALGASIRDLAWHLLLPLKPVLLRGAAAGVPLALVLSSVLRPHVSARGGNLLLALLLAAVIVGVTMSVAAVPPIRRVARHAPLRVMRDL